MNFNSVKVFASNVLARLSQSVINIIIGFLMMPFFFSELGATDYSLWILIGSITSAYYIMDLGITNVLSRYLVREIKDKNSIGANQYINSALIIYISIAIFIMVFIIFLGWYLPNTVAFSSYSAETARWVLLLTGAALAFEFPAKAFAGIITAYEKFNVIAYSRIFFSVLTALLNYHYLVNGYGVVCMALIGLLMSLASTCVYVFLSTRLFSNLSISKQYVKLSVLKDLYRFSKWTFLVDLFVIAKNRADVWGVSYYLGPHAVAVYYVGLRLVDYAITFISQLTGIMMPALARSYFGNQLSELREKTIIFLNVVLVAAIIFFSGLFILGEGFIARWMGSDFDYKSAYLCMIIVLAGKLLKYIFDPVRTALFSAGHPELIAYISGVELLISFVLMLVLAPQYGLMGVSFATAAPFLITRVILMPILLKKYVKIGVNVFYISLLQQLALIVLLAFTYQKIMFDYTYSQILLHGLLITFICIAYTAMIHYRFVYSLAKQVILRLK